MSKEAIIKALPEDYVRRMRNWAKADACAVSYAMTSAYEGERSDGYDTHMPILLGEAHDTHAALGAVPNRERQAVMLFWQFEGQSLRDLGRRLRVNHETAQARVVRGHELHIGEIRRLIERHHAMIESNRVAMESFVHATRTGSIPTVLRIKALDMAKIRQ